MKKIVVLISVTMGLFASVNAQQINIKNVKEVDFYGVDFSLAVAPDVEETPDQFKKGIVEINKLLYREVKKYDFKKYIGKKIAAYNYDITDSNNNNIDAEILTSRTRKVEISEADIQKIISALSTEPNDKVGLIFIAETLSKTDQAGTFYVVFFDEATKQIAYSKKVTGKAGGFGVRNYWAASIFSVLKKWNWK
jgi:hypothetical protein